MNKFWLILVIALSLGCEDTMVEEHLTGIGTVFVSSGIMDCHTWIELDNNEKLFPQNWTDYQLGSGDRVNIQYEIIDKTTSCEGTDCLLFKANLLSGKAYVDLNYSNYDSLENDPVKINAVNIEGDLLVVNLSYSGGCQEHIIDLARLHPSCGTPPLPPPSLQIRHNANNDACEAWINETLQFDITRLRESGESPMTFSFTANEYGDNHFQKELSYEFE